jgi:broad specificity phosphatase PhoE
MNINLYLIRHSQSYGNLCPKDKRPKDDNFSITEKGIIQANISGKFLENYFTKNKINIDKVLVSNKLRTLQTYKIQKKFLNYNMKNKRIKIIKLPKNNINIKRKYNIEDFINFINQYSNKNKFNTLLFYTHKGFIRDFYTFLNSKLEKNIDNNNIYKISLKFNQSNELIKKNINLIKDFSYTFSKIKPTIKDNKTCDLFV